MGSTTHMRRDEAQIRMLSEARVRAVQAKEVPAALGGVDTDVVVFAALTPLPARGVGAVRARLEDWVASFDGPLGHQIRALLIMTAGAVTFSHCLNHDRGTTRAGALDRRVRATTGDRKRDEEWRMTHERQSTPFDPRRGKACLDLEP